MSAPIPEEPSPAPPTTALVVRLRAAGDRVPLVGYGVALCRNDDLHNLARVSVFRATDARGTVRFEDLEPDRWFVEIERLGHAAIVELSAGETVEKVIDVPASVIVLGQVVDETGRPVAEADIVVQGSRLGAPSVARTDVLGRFEVRHIQGVELQATKPGFAPSLAHFVQGQPDQRVELELRLGPAGSRITGRALDAEGAPLADAVVAIVPAAAKLLTASNHDKPQPRPLWLRTAADGTFATEEVGADQFLVIVTPANRAIPASWGDADTRQADAFVELRSGRPTVIEGTVREGGEPLAGVLLNAGSESYLDLGSFVNLIGARSTHTDAEGTFRIVGTLPGEVVVRAFRGSESLGIVRRQMAAGETTRWDLDVRAGRELRIEIEASAALPRALVAMVYEFDTPNQAPSMVPFQGDVATCPVRGTGPALVVVAQMPGGRSIVHLARRRVAADESVVHFTLDASELPVRSIRGRLVDEVLAPVAGRSVAVRRTDGRGLAVVFDGTTAEDGTFALGPLPAGRYAILTGNLMLSEPIGDIVLTAARDEDAGDLKLEKR